MKLPVLMRKVKIDIALCPLLGIFAPKVSGISVCTARRSEQGKADCVKYGSLARSGVAGDQKQSFFLKLCEINIRHSPCIRAERAHDQFNRLHR